MRLLLLLAPLLLLFACDDTPFGDAVPKGYGMQQETTADGVQVEVSLTGIERATLAGQTVSDKQTITIPWDKLRVGVNEFPFEGGAFDEYARVEVIVGINDALQPVCDQETGVRVLGERAPDYFGEIFRASGCPIVAGEIKIPVSLRGGVTPELSKGRVEGGALYFPLAQHALEIPLTKDSSFGSGTFGYETELTLRYADRDSFRQTLSVSVSDGPARVFYDGLPKTLALLKRQPAAKPKVAVFEAGDHLWATGEVEGRTLGQADIFITIEGSKEPRAIGTCGYRTLDGGSFFVDVMAKDQIFVAWDAAGRELARTTLSAGCPGGGNFSEGDTVTSVPGDGAVRNWAEELLKRGASASRTAPKKTSKKVRKKPRKKPRKKSGGVAQDMLRGR